MIQWVVVVYKFSHDFSRFIIVRAVTAKAHVIIFNICLHNLVNICKFKHQPTFLVIFVHYALFLNEHLLNYFHSLFPVLKFAKESKN